MRIAKRADTCVIMASQDVADEKALFFTLNIASTNLTVYA